MNNIYISVVSHHHDEFIINNKSLHKISELPYITVVIKDNVSSSVLNKECNDLGYIYISEDNQVGFGENNNDIFNECRKLGMRDDDWFICLNPDVTIDIQNFHMLVKELSFAKSALYTINLYKDSDYTVIENSLRVFPNWISPLKLVTVGSVAKPYDKSVLPNYSTVDWASGAFLIFKAKMYDSLNGFDVSFFMYYEDVDICYRARNNFNIPVIYLKTVKAVHEGAYQNRKILSQHFRWYLKSLFLFLLRK